MDQVVESLCRAFPDLPDSRVRECVDRVHADLDGARVRAYLPILVAREARAELSAVVDRAGPDVLDPADPVGVSLASR